MPNITFENDFFTDPLWIKSIQFFPNDLNLRNQYFIKSIIEDKSADSNDSDKFEIDAKSLKLMIGAPSLEEFKLKRSKIIKEATVIGDVLNIIYLMVKFNLPEPSLNKAYFVSQQFAKETKYGDGTPMAISERYIKDKVAKIQTCCSFMGSIAFFIKSTTT